mmetsp:Transcript_39529/g.80640  ORF Transcript_39529/g.80640 Transcript_39529/m.80640 type:complete len:352 (-) Transcript_39529:135-1190(-)
MRCLPGPTVVFVATVKSACPCSSVYSDAFVSVPTRGKEVRAFGTSSTERASSKGAWWMDCPATQGNEITRGSLANPEKDKFHEFEMDRTTAEMGSKLSMMPEFSEEIEAESHMREDSAFGNPSPETTAYLEEASNLAQDAAAAKEHSNFWPEAAELSTDASRIITKTIPGRSLVVFQSHGTAQIRLGSSPGREPNAATEWWSSNPKSLGTVKLSKWRSSFNGAGCMENAAVDTRDSSGCEKVFGEGVEVAPDTAEEPCNRLEDGGVMKDGARFVAEVAALPETEVKVTNNVQTEARAVACLKTEGTSGTAQVKSMSESSRTETLEEVVLRYGAAGRASNAAAGTSRDSITS